MTDSKSFCKTKIIQICYSLTDLTIYLLLPDGRDMSKSCAFNVHKKSFTFILCLLFMFTINLWSSNYCKDQECMLQSNFHCLGRMHPAGQLPTNDYWTSKWWDLTEICSSVFYRSQEWFVAWVEISTLLPEVHYFSSEV